jgi:RimJ/RimL family protein N-acetyltransferase
MVTTDRLTITDTCLNDLPEIEKSLDDKGIHANMVAIPDNINDWFYSDTTKLTVRLKTNNELVGVVCINIFSTTADIGGWCCEKFRNNGYAVETYKSVSKTLFENGIHKITANYVKGNRLAQKLLESLDFVYNTTLKEQAALGPKYVDIIVCEKFSNSNPKSSAY